MDQREGKEKFHMPVSFLRWSGYEEPIFSARASQRKDTHFMEESGRPFKSGLVALIGPPNAGKSTLLNTIIGEKVAIVSPKPQTTRNQISGIHTREDAQVVFLDTPGIHQSRMRLNRCMVDAAWKALYGADMVILMLDGYRYASRPDLWDKDLASVVRNLAKSSLPLCVVLNKIDMIGSRERLFPLLAKCQKQWPDTDVFPVSAAKGTNVDRLMDTIIATLPAGPPMYDKDQLSTLPLRFMVTEIIREKLFLTMQEELPYNLAVDIDAWEENPASGLLEITATIYVSKPGYKGMIIGKGGKTLKKIGSMARPEIVELVGSKVFLELWVKVKSQWTDDRQFLTGLGLE
jgi:GTP-binding protein Era